MFDFFQKSLRNKLLLTFIFIGFLPFVTLLVYTIFLSETKIANKIINEQFLKTDTINRRIINKVKALKKEVDFLASLDVMDEILADDIDKKISRLLIQKSKDLSLNNSFIIVNKQDIVIAASKKKDLLKKIKIKDITQNKHEIYIKGKTLFIRNKINATFAKQQNIGYIMFKYSLNNFNIYLTNELNKNSYIFNPKNKLFIGKEKDFILKFNKDHDSIISDKHLIVYKKMEKIFKNWYIVYSVKKDVALEFLYDFIRFMLYISIPIILLIIYVSIKYAKGIVRPIEELTYITDSITNTQNYSAKLSINSKDEIATLSNSFNDMLKTTSSALAKLEEENELRLKRFIQLTEVFNTIIQTKSEEECINTSMQQIKLLTGESELSFVQKKLTDTTKPNLPLYTTVILGLEKYDDENEQKFYNSIGAMITLQLDKIRLMDKTISASHAKSAFISNMSHELRTPLNAIIGSSQYMITYEELSDEQQDTMSNIESSAHYLLKMINEILDIAKIEAGKMETHFEKTDILKLITSTYNMLQPLANDKSLIFEIETNDFENKLYDTDPKMFQQVVINLVSNAIKFTEAGNVHIKLFNEKNTIFVKVQDSGIGISQDDIKQLFNDFTQVENIMQKKHKGTGLGLSLSKKIAHLLNGDVNIESKGLNKGTTTIFTIKV